MKENIAPSRLGKPAKDAGTVRERTLAHLEHLMRVAATTAGTGMLLASSAQGQQRNCPVVVDPPPPPPQGCCENPEQLLLRVCIDAYANWEQVRGQWNLRLTVYARDSKSIGFEGLGKPDITLSGITLKEMQTRSDALNLLLAPVGEEKSPSLQFPVKCNAKKLILKLSLDLKEGPGENCRAVVRQVK